MQFPSRILSIPKTLSFDALLAPLADFLSLPLEKIITHPDVVRIVPEEKKTSIAIAQVHKLNTRSSFRPTFAKQTSIVFFPADALTLPAQQSLLKLLEEPPAFVQFLLITDRPYALLPTIISRCSIVPLLIQDASTSTSFDVTLPLSFGEALQQSDTYSSREAAITYIEQIITHASDVLLRQHAIEAYTRLQQNINVKLTLDTFFFALVQRK